MRLPIFALATLALGLTSLAAHAVDLPPAPILDEDNDDETLGSGWYLRADAGALEPSLPRRSRDRGADGLSALVGGRLDRAFVLGGGLGYQFSPWFRADLTIDHRFDDTFRGARLASNGYAVDRGELDATTFFANGYVDLPLWSGITPYLGAGIGVANLRLGQMERQAFGGSSAAIPLDLPSHRETVLAWALMGGVAFDLTARLKIDLGYRYTRLGGFDSAHAPIRSPQLSAHEVRIGARYLFD